MIKLKQVRLEKKLKPADFCRRCAWDKETLKRVEAGETLIVGYGELARAVFGLGLYDSVLCPARLAYSLLDEVDE